MTGTYMRGTLRPYIDRDDSGPDMIHVCSLARLHDTVAQTGASHIVTLLRLIDRVERPRSIAPDNHLILGMDDITVAARRLHPSGRGARRSS